MVIDAVGWKDIVDCFCKQRQVKRGTAIKRGHKGSLMCVTLHVYGSGSCYVLDSNNNQHIYIYISTEDDECNGWNYIVFCIYRCICVEKLL